MLLGRHFVRKELKVIETTSLTLHIDYDHLTTGELGNILIRLQAALRSMAGLSPGEYYGEYSYAQPRFIISSVNTKNSIDIVILAAVLSIAADTPNAINNLTKFSAEVFRRFRIAILALASGELEVPRISDKPGDLNSEHLEELTTSEDTGLKVQVTKGKIDIELSRPMLNELTVAQRRRLMNFIWSLTGPARKVDIVLALPLCDRIQSNFDVRVHSLI